MDPITLATISLVSTVGGGVLKGIGAARADKAAAEAASYQAGVARNNQIIADNNAQREIDKGRVDEQAKRMQTQALIGSLAASAGGSGFDVNSGSKLEVRKSTADLGDLDALTIRNNALARSDAYKNQSAQFAADAGMKDRAAAYAKSSMGWDIASSAIDMGSSVSDKWLRFKQVGVF